MTSIRLLQQRNALLLLDHGRDDGLYQKWIGMVLMFVTYEIIHLVFLILLGYTALLAYWNFTTPLLDEEQQKIWYGGTHRPEVPTTADPPPPPYNPFAAATATAGPPPPSFSPRGQSDFEAK